MGQVISTIIVGLIVGILARFFYPGPVPMGIIGSIALGVVGSLVGGFVQRLFSGNRAAAPFQPAGLIGSVLGAMLVIFIVHQLR